MADMKRVTVLSHHQRGGGTPLDSLWFSKEACEAKGVRLTIVWTRDLFKGVSAILASKRVLFDGMASVKQYWGPLFYILAHLFFRKVSIYWHETDWYLDAVFNSPPSLKSSVKKVLYRHLLGSARVVHYHVNTYGKKMLHEKFKVDNDHILVLHNISDSSRLLGYPLPARAEKHLFVACGAVNERKGVDIFLDIAKKVTDRLQDARFLWIGGFGEGEYSKERLDERIRASGLEGKVIFSGPMSNPAEMMVKASAFLLTSRDDPMPKVLMEALAIGRHCIAFGVGGIPELLGPMGKIIPPMDVNAFIDAVLSSDAGDDEALQIERRQRYMDLFSPEAFGRRFSEAVIWWDRVG